MATIARKGPSSFIFELVYNDDILNQQISMYRKELNLSMRDFVAIFDVSLATVHKIEANKIKDSEVIKRLLIYKKFPQVALYEIEKNATKINEKTKNRLAEFIKTKIKN